MDYTNIATCVFTPLEYGCVGWREDKAIEKYGDENIEVYHTHFKPLEWNFLESNKESCYIKVIVNLVDDKVLGIHFLGPNAGEII